MISMDKKYTLNGKPFTVSMVSKPGPLPVLGYDNLGNVSEFTAHGHYGPSSLVEVSPWVDFMVDEKVMVRDFEDQLWIRGYFAGISNERPFVWSFGAQKWSSGDDRTHWDQCRRPTKEELST